MTSITFATNKGSHGPFGQQGEKELVFNFRLGPDRPFGRFHGSTKDGFLESIGVYVKPIATLSNLNNAAEAKKDQVPDVFKVKLDYPDEFLTSVSGSYSVRNPCGIYECGSTYKLTSISFGTNKCKYGPFGEPGEYSKNFDFQLGQDQAFGGFHGSTTSDGFVETIGVYVKPITTHPQPTGKADNGVFRLRSPTGEAENGVSRLRSPLSVSTAVLLLVVLCCLRFVFPHFYC